ncbi:MAG: hypothetical protein FJY85_18925, partial [Deltaproteobacteria bacterium]|nr:hypothetical protein [Deltaproteobacteria bacterium]
MLGFNMPGASRTGTDRDHLGDGEINDVLGVLDKEPPWVLRKLIPVLSSRVTVDGHAVERLRDLARSSHVVYALKYRTIYDVYFMKMRFRELGLPVPSFVFGLTPLETGSVRRAFLAWRERILDLFHQKRSVARREERVLEKIFEQGEAAVLFLVDEKTSRARYIVPDKDPFRILLDFQGRLSGAISLVPVFVLYDRRRPRTIRPFWESFLGDPDHPGWLRRLLIAFRKWTVPELLIGEPLHLLSEFEEFGSEKSWEELPFEIRKDLVASVNDRIRVNRGPERLSRTEIKERVLQDTKVQRAVSRAVAR